MGLRHEGGVGRGPAPLVRRWGPVGVTAALLLGLLLGAGTPAVPAPPAAGSPVGRLQVMVRHSGLVGTPVVVDVLGAAAGAPVHLITGGALNGGDLVSTAGPGGVARFVLHVENRWAGWVELTARSRDAVGRQGFRLDPLPVLGPVQSVVGARSIVADAADLAMTVTIPMDELGNAPLDGTPVTHVRIWPDGRDEVVRIPVRGLLAHQDNFSGTVAGKDYIHAEIDGQSGTATTLLEVAGPPVPFGLTVRRAAPRADGHTLVELVTDTLQDRYGNVQPNGVLVTLQGSGPLGAWQLQSPVVDGTASFVFPALDRPGLLELSGVCRGTLSRGALAVGFDSNGTSLPVTAERVKKDVLVRVGPVTDRTGALVNDGALVRVRGRTDDRHREVEGRLDGGVLDLVLPADDLVPAELTVTMLGLQATMGVP